MQEKHYFPAVHVLKENKGVRATAGIRLASVLDPSLLERTHNRTKLQEESCSEHIRFLQSLASWPGHVNLVLNIFSSPDIANPMAGHIVCALFVSVVNQQEKKAIAEVLNRYGTLRSLLANSMSHREFQPIFEEDDLLRALNPFAPGHTVSFTKQQIDFKLNRYAEGKGKRSTPGQIGFISQTVPSQNADKFLEEEHIVFAPPWVPATTDISNIAEAILWHPAPLWLQVRLQPAAAGGKEESDLMEALFRCEELLLKRSLPEQTILTKQVNSLRDAITDRLQQGNNAAFRYGIFLNSTVALDEAMIELLGRTIVQESFAHDKSVKQTGRFLTASYPMGKFSDLGQFPANGFLTPREAACAFRLPLPARTNCPGLPVRKYRTSLAPASIIRISEHRDNILLGINRHQGYANEIRLSTEDRMRHMCLLGQSGTGKSTLLNAFIQQDIRAGRGLCLIDPHGDLVQPLLASYPWERRQDLILIDMLDPDYVVPMNLLHWQTIQERDFIVDELLVIFDQLYNLSQTGGPIFEQYFRTFLRLLLGDRPHENFIPTILDFQLLFQNRKFRRLCAEANDDPTVLRQIKEVEDAGGETQLANVAPYVNSKLNRFLMDTSLQHILCQEEQKLDFENIMNTGKVVLINFGGGRLGPLAANLLSRLIVARFRAAAMARAGIPMEQRRDFFLYVDEFQNIVSDHFANLLSEARKYRLGLVLANQYADQLAKQDSSRGGTILDAILGNVGTQICFRLGIKDAKRMEDTFLPSFSATDLLNLPKYECYLRVDAGKEKPESFNMHTIYQELQPDREKETKLRALTNKKYAVPAETAQQNIKQHQEKIKALID